MNIYLAGKIGKVAPHNWREEILGTRGDASSDAEKIIVDWPVREKAIFDAHNYTGPYFIACDHGCAHGPNQHGIGLDQGGCLGFSHEAAAPDARRTVRLCTQAIARSNLVFAWIYDTTCFGSLWELGYARAVPNVCTVIAFKGKRLADLWFAAEGADVCIDDRDTPLAALDAAIGWHTKYHPPRNLHVCESPIEWALLDALEASMTPAESSLLHSQYQVDRYRLDFAVIAPDRKIAIECDGHDFHERTAAQAERDRSRDRALTSSGWIVLRFTGREIWRDVNRCAREVLDNLRKEL